MSRSVGIKRDLRLNKLETYGNYYYLNSKFNKNYFKKYNKENTNFEQITTITPHNVLNYLHLKK